MVLTCSCHGNQEAEREGRSWGWGSTFSGPIFGIHLHPAHNSYQKTNCSTIRIQSPSKSLNSTHMKPLGDIFIQTTTHSILFLIYRDFFLIYTFSLAISSMTQGGRKTPIWIFMIFPMAHKDILSWDVLFLSVHAISPIRKLYFESLSQLLELSHIYSQGSKSWNFPMIPHSRLFFICN